jgi:hypothetical protein
LREVLPKQVLLKYTSLRIYSFVLLQLNEEIKSEENKKTTYPTDVASLRNNFYGQGTQEPGQTSLNLEGGKGN